MGYRSLGQMFPLVDPINNKQYLEKFLEGSCNTKPADQEGR